MSIGQPAEREQAQRHQREHHHGGDDGPLDGQVREEHGYAPSPFATATRSPGRSAKPPRVTTWSPACTPDTHFHRHAVGLARSSPARFSAWSPLDHEHLGRLLLEVPVEQRLARHLQHARSGSATTIRPFTNAPPLSAPSAVRHLGDDLRRAARLVDRRVDEHHLAGERAAGQRVGRELDRLADLARPRGATTAPRPSGRAAGCRRCGTAARCRPCSRRGRRR